MKKILFIAMEFPPLQTTGCYRSIYFVKYLKLYGIEPIVITISPEEGYTPFNATINNRLLDLIPEDVKVYRIFLKKSRSYKIMFFKKLHMYLKIIDILRKNWEPYLLKELPGIIEEHNPKAIYINCPPFVNGTIAPKLNRLYSLPIILDMRDAWSTWCIRPFSTFLHYWSVYLLEKNAFSAATSIVTVTQELKEVFCESHIGINPDKISVVPNGFDFTYKPGSISFPGLNTDNRPIIIAYTGMYYYEPMVRKDMFCPNGPNKLKQFLQYSPVDEDWLYRSPYFFLKTIAALIEVEPNLKGKLKFVHIGNKPHWMDDMVQHFDLKENVCYTGILPHGEVNNRLQECDLFLATSVKIKGGKDYALASKTFDYLFHKKAVLGFVSPGAQLNFIKNSNTGVVINPDDTAQAIEKLKDIFYNGLSLEPNIPFLEEFNRINTTKKLSEIIKSNISQ